MNEQSAGLLTRPIRPYFPPEHLPDVVPAERAQMSLGAGGAVPLNTTGWTGWTLNDRGHGYVGMDILDSSTHIRAFNPMAGSSMGFNRMHEETAEAMQEQDEQPRRNRRRKR